MLDANYTLQKYLFNKRISSVMLMRRSRENNKKVILQKIIKVYIKNYTGCGKHTEGKWQKKQLELLEFMIKIFAKNHMRDLM